MKKFYVFLEIIKKIEFKFSKFVIRIKNFKLKMKFISGIFFLQGNGYD